MKHPPGTATEPEPEDVKEVQDADGSNGVGGDDVNIEEDIGENDLGIDEVDEEGLFTSEFDNLMDPSYQSGYGESMDWMNDM